VRQLLQVSRSTYGAQQPLQLVAVQQLDDTNVVFKAHLTLCISNAMPGEVQNAAAVQQNLRMHNASKGHTRP
jgi:hypothetical protein